VCGEKKRETRKSFCFKIEKNNIVPIQMAQEGRIVLMIKKNGGRFDN